MLSAHVYAIVSVIIVSLIALVGIIPFLLKKKVSERLLLILVSLSAGTLFGGAFLHLLPEALENQEVGVQIMLTVILGILVFFVLEKFIHWHHSSDHPSKAHKQMHGHAYHLAPLNLIGDGIHNLLDGIVIAAGYLVSIPLGIATTISVLLHEVPQEVADFGVLLYSGMSKKRAILFNLLSAGMALIGVIIGIILNSRVAGFSNFILPFAAGSFIYIAGSNLVPELHKHCKLRESLYHLLAMVFGIGIMAALLFLE